MIGVKNLQSVFESKSGNITTIDFINIHRGVEAYLRRLLFIGLRLNGVQYKTASEVVCMSYSNNRDLIKNTIKLISLNTIALEDLEEQNSDFKALLQLFFEFTSVYRNRVFHGVEGEIYDSLTLQYCYLIDKSLIVEFELSLQYFGFKSAFETPKAWGASRSVNPEKFDQVINRLKLGKLSKNPMSTISVQNLIARTKYAGKI